MKLIKIFFAIFLLIIPLFLLFYRVSNIHAADPSFDEFTIPTENSYPWGITAGPDGNLWFTEWSGDKIGRITPSGSITEFPLPSTNNPTGVAGITTGPDGNIWYTDASANKIGRITPSGTITEFVIPTTNSKDPLDIAAGPDGNLWFVEWIGDKIGRITPTGIITEFALSVGRGPRAITAGPDGNLWFVESSANKIGRITPSGTITEFTVPTGGSYPADITAGPDGNLWFTEEMAKKIGRITPSGTITEYPISSSDSNPWGITAGLDGNLWFTEYYGNRIGRITPSGTITEFNAPTSESAPYFITSGPDGNLWFTEANGNKIGRINLSNPLPPPVSQYTFHTSFSGHIPDNNQELALTGSVPYNIKLTKLVNNTEEPVSNANLTLTPGTFDPERHQIGNTNAEGILSGRLSIPEYSGDITKEFIIETTLQGTDHIFSNPTLFYKGELDSNFSVEITQDEIDLYTDQKFKDLYKPSLPCPGTACAYLQLIDIMAKLFIENPHEYNPKIGDKVGYSIEKYEVPNIPIAYKYHQTIQRPYNNFEVIQEDTWWSENRLHFPSGNYIARNSLIVEVASPVTLMVKDPQGHEAGYDSQTGQNKFDFPIYISKVGSEPYLLIVPSPQNGTYSLSVTGTDQGAYTMTTYLINENGNKTSQTVIKDNTSLDQLARYELIMSDSSNLKVMPQIIINDGEEFTNFRKVLLHLASPIEASQMRVSNNIFDKKSKFPRWQRFESDIDWQLNGGNGKKNVYVQFKTTNGETTGIYRGSIIFDNRKPLLRDVEINKGEKSTKNPKVLITINARDNLSGIKYMKVSNNKDLINTNWQLYKKEFDWTLEPLKGNSSERRRVFIQLKDNSQNISRVLSGFILLKP